MATVRSQLNDFELEEFFRSLQALLVSSLNVNISFDTAEFLSRRLDGYERNLSVLFSRVRESFPREEELLAEFTNLLQIVHQQRVRCETLSFRSFLLENPDTVQHAQACVRLCRTGVGRPRLQIPQGLLETLHVQVGFSWAEIARNLGVSESTLRRRRRLFELPSTGRIFSNIDDRALDEIVRGVLQITPRIGYRLVQGALRRRGLHVQRRRVLESLRRVDPVMITLRCSRSIIRRRYSVPCPNALWLVLKGAEWVRDGLFIYIQATLYYNNCITIVMLSLLLCSRDLDGNHKLIQPYRFVIHGGIDGFSRLVVFLKVSTNNRASTVLECFREAVSHYNRPSRVRTDLGLENIDVARFMLESRGLESVVLDVTNELHLFVLHFVYTPLINHALAEFTESWNSHSLSTERNLSPRQLWIQGMITSRNTNYSAVISVQSGLQINWDEYGIDEDGPVADLQSDYNVTVPESTVNISDQHPQNIQQIASIIKEAGDQDGIIAFLVILHTLQQLGY